MPCFLWLCIILLYWQASKLIGSILKLKLEHESLKTNKQLWGLARPKGPTVETNQLRRLTREPETEMKHLWGPDPLKAWVGTSDSDGDSKVAWLEASQRPSFKPSENLHMAGRGGQVALGPRPQDSQAPDPMATGAAQQSSQSPLMPWYSSCTGSLGCTGCSGC